MGILACRAEGCCCVAAALVLGSLLGIPAATTLEEEEALFEAFPLCLCGIAGW